MGQQERASGPVVLRLADLLGPPRAPCYLVSNNETTCSSDEATCSSDETKFSSDEVKFRSDGTACSSDETKCSAGDFDLLEKHIIWSAPSTGIPRGARIW